MKWTTASSRQTGSTQRWRLARESNLDRLAHGLWDTISPIRERMRRRLSSGMGRKSSTWDSSTMAPPQTDSTGRSTMWTDTTQTASSTTKTESAWDSLERLRDLWATEISRLAVSGVVRHRKTLTPIMTGIVKTGMHSLTDEHRRSGMSGKGFGRRIRHLKEKCLIQMSLFFLTLSIRLLPSSGQNSADSP